MYGKYGSYQHATNEVGIRRIQRSAGKAQGGQITSTIKRYTVGGMLHGDTISALTSAIRALENAYSTQGLDWGLYEDTGTATAHVLTSSDSSGGVQVIDFSWVESPGEYTTYRSYEIQLEAEYQVGNGINFSSWNEDLSFEGDGGPVYRYIPTLNGPWQKQMVSERSTYRATQSGQIVAIFTDPDAPGPIWPDQMHREQSRVSRQGPVFDGTKYTNFGVSWSYVFESNSPLSGFPNRQPG